MARRPETKCGPVKREQESPVLSKHYNVERVVRKLKLAIVLNE